MKNVADYFGENVFNENVMKARLPKETFKAVKNTMDNGKRLDPAAAAVVANAMKEWAIEKGATHYTHWFQPMTGITAEKHDSFISPSAGGSVIMEFSGKELIQGEPDASSFPSGGLRATFEARGYTAWDPTSFAFIKDGVLCIPTAFCSYGGEALDKKTPLLRSMEAVNRQAMRILKLFGAMPPKGQELEDHYFGVIKPRVQAFMKDLNDELWKLGILAKTEHNEVAPAQHELAPIFATTNIAADHNQLTMEIMQKVAKKHGLVCLLHEKPFAGVNGSGKHNNWSISTNTGVNLLEPGDTPHENAQFLLFLCAVIKAVDDYQDLLRISVASAGNDHRLGANEAPPAVISVFLGEELTEILEAIEKDEPYGGKEKELMKVGVHVLPKFPKDTTDRNRTSPFAFTGNKFEFRMLGSAASVSGSNVVLNTVVAEELKQFADELENKQDLTAALHDLIQRTIKEHKRIIFNGNGYDDAWIAEAEKRGLSNLKTTPDALSHWLDEKNVTLFTTHKVFSEAEMKSRNEILFETYEKLIKIEARTMVDMAYHDLLPCISKYVRELDLNLTSDYEKNISAQLTGLMDKAYNALTELETQLEKSVSEDDVIKSAFICKDNVIPAMNELRKHIDKAETLTASEYWAIPTYGELLFDVR